MTSATNPRILIIGSCVTRDVHRVDDGRTLDLAGYVARTSFASAYAKKAFDRGHFDLAAIKSDFQRRMVEIDLEKRLPSLVDGYEYDLLVVDFIDERFRLLEDDEGRIATGSNELLAAVDPQRDFSTRINSGTRLHFERWQAGWNDFVAQIGAAGRLDRLRVNKVFWAECSSDGSDGIEGFDLKKIRAANAYLRQLYDHVASTTPEGTLLDFPETLFVADTQHQWGLSPFHYVEDFYDAARARIREEAEQVGPPAPAEDETPEFPIAQLHLHPLTTIAEQETTGFVGGASTKPWPYALPLDWNADPFKHRNWRFRLASWRLMDVYIDDFVKTDSKESLAKAFAVARDWHRFFLRDGNESDFKWYDMATGLRGARIGYLADQVERGALQLTPEDTQILDELGEAHLERLTTDKEIALNNHGLFQVFGLEMLARYWRRGRHLEEAREFGLRYLRKIMALSFTPEGVHMEASPEYHTFVLQALERSCRGSAFAGDIRADLDRARAVEPFLAMPDGRFPAFGDTDNDKINAKHKQLRPDRIEIIDGVHVVIKDLTASGYALARTLPRLPLERSWALFVTGMAHVKVHKHADDLGFVFDLDGHPLFVDPGKFFYDYSDSRKNIVSAQAHNVISLDGRVITPHEVEFVGSQLHGIASNEEGVSISGTVVRPDLLRHTRIFDLKPGKRLEIRDLARKSVPNAFLNRLNVHPDVDVEGDETEVRLTLASGRVVRVRSRSHAPIALHKGKKGPWGGWFSPSYSKIVACTTLETRFETDYLDDGWVVDFG